MTQMRTICLLREVNSALGLEQIGIFFDKIPFEFCTTKFMIYSQQFQSCFLSFSYLKQYQLYKMISLPKYYKPIKLIFAMVVPILANKKIQQRQIMIGKIWNLQMPEQNFHHVMFQSKHRFEYFGPDHV